MRGMPPQPHPPVAEGAWLRPRPARQSPDCRRGRVHRHASRRPKRVRLKAAAFPAQHIRSALSQGVAGGSAHRRLRRIPAGRRVRMRRGLPSPGSVGILPFAGSAASRLPPSASPAGTASASCRRPSSRSAPSWHLGGKCAVFAHAAPLLRPMRTIRDRPHKRSIFQRFCGACPHGFWSYGTDEKKPLRAILSLHTPLAQPKVRGTRTAETDMCN